MISNARKSNIEPNPQAEKAYLNEKELAERLNVSEKWVQKMRGTGGGVRFHKWGRMVRYAIADVVAFEGASVRNSTSDLGQPAPQANALCNIHSRVVNVPVRGNNDTPKHDPLPTSQVSKRGSFSK